MELSKDDIVRLEKLGYNSTKFSVKDEEGIIKLRNVHEWCFFYDISKRKCKIYVNRPVGCFLYPVVYAIGDGITIDEICPMGDTLSRQEIRFKGKILIKLLKNEKLAFLT